MADYKEKIISDLPDQFKGKERIEALAGVIGRQLDDLAQFYDDLNTKRSLSTAEGVQLDMIGSILGITRKEAGELISDAEAVQDDETYRTVLKYKVLQNTSKSTYYDIIRAMQLVYGATDPQYSEDPEDPARITISTTGLDTANLISAVWSVLMVKPAGVQMCFDNQFALPAPLYFGTALITLNEVDIGCASEEI